MLIRKFKPILAEKREIEPKVAILDTFDQPGRHGEFVESLISKDGFQDADIQRYNNSVSLSESPLKAGPDFGDQLDTFIQATPTAILGQTTANLQDVLDQGHAGVVNVSMGDSKIDAMKRVMTLAKNRSLGAALWKELEVAPYADEKVRIQALARRVDSVVDTSDTVRTAKEEFGEVVSQAHESGVFVVLAAGNEGRLAKLYGEAGIEVNDDFFRSHLAGAEEALVVGASNSSGKPAPLTPPNAEVDLGAPGTFVVGEVGGRPDIRSGTSFAAPQVSGWLAKQQAEHPEMSKEQLSASLMESLTPAENEDLLGAGVLL